MTLSVKDAGVWKTVTQPYVKDAGVWKAIQQVYVKDVGVWKLVYQSGPSFTPAPGTYSAEDTGSAYFTVTASEAVTWTYAKSVTVVASHPNGSVTTAITFSVSAGVTDKSGTIDLTATKDGVTYNWTIDLTAYGTG